MTVKIWQKQWGRVSSAEVKMAVYAELVQLGIELPLIAPCSWGRYARELDAWRMKGPVCTDSYLHVIDRIHVIACINGNTTCTQGT